MKHNLFWRITGIVTLLTIVFGASFTTPGQPTHAQTPSPGIPQVLYPVINDLSPALATLKAIQPPKAGGTPAFNEVPVYEIPTRQRPEGNTGTGTAPDPAGQGSFGPGLMPSPAINFAGISNTDNAIPILPPDTQGDIGPEFYVQWVNLSFAIWSIDRSAGAATLAYGPVPGNTLWQGFGGLCESHNDGDPITLYDPLADRWLMSQFALGAENHQCIAISQTADPTGAWYRYDYNWGAKFNDYPKFGVWPDAYYLTVNQFTGNTWAGAAAAAFEREKMLQGLPARIVLFDLYGVDSSLGGMLPSDLDGPPPPAGAPNFFVQMDDDAWGYSPDQLRFFSFHVDWNNPLNSTFAAANTLNLTTLGYPFDSEICNADRGRCIDQPGTAYRLESLSDRLMHRAAYRNFGDHQSIVITHTVDAASNPPLTPGRGGIRWYEVRLPGGAPSLYQAGTYSPDSAHRWMSSGAMDRQGNIAIGYSISSTALSPSIRYTGRLVGDPPDTLPQGEGTIISGGGSQLYSGSRSGDYSMLSVDPVDDCTFWYTQEYYAISSTSGWRTRIASFRFPSCQTAPLGTLQGVVLQAGINQPIPGAIVTAGAYTTLSDANGFYQFAYLPEGTYSVTAAAYGFSPHTVNNVIVSGGAVTTRDITLVSLALVTVSGVVSDATPAGHTWPLYASIEINGYPQGLVYTDPSTGFYQVQLPAGSPIDFTVRAAAGGYSPAFRQVTPAPTGSVEDFGLVMDGAVCSAPGYSRPGFFEGFESGVPPAGWQVIDTAGTGVIWKWSATWQQANWTGGAGQAAAVNSDLAGAKAFDTALVSPDFITANLASQTLTFKANYQNLMGLDSLDVDISPNGGAWVNLLHWASDHGLFQSLPGESTGISLAPYLAGVTHFSLRWRYYDPTGIPPAGDWYAQVDDVGLQGACTAQPGGLLVGTTTDANNHQPLVGVTIQGPAGSTLSMPPDGFYQLYSPSGSHTFNATAAAGYGPLNAMAVISADALTQVQFAFPASLITPAPGQFTFHLLPGQTAAPTLQLTNTGTLTGNVKVYEVNAPYRKPLLTGPFAQAGRAVSPKHLADLDGSAIYYSVPSAAQWPDAGGIITQWASPLAYSWGIGFNQAAGDVWLSSPLPGGGDGFDHRLSASGVLSADTIDTRLWGGTFAADMAYNPYTGMFWQVNVGGDNCIYELNPITKMDTGVKLCPAFASSQRGLAYNPLDDSFYSGSWNDGILYHFSATGQVLDSFNTSLAISGLAYNPDTNHLFALINSPGSLTASDIYVLEARYPYPILGAFNLNAPYNHRWGGGLDMNCSGSLWAVDTLGQVVYLAQSGETSACAYQQIPWLTAAPTQGAIPVSNTLAINLGLNWSGYIPNRYEGYLRIETGSPYGPVFVPLLLQAGYPNILPWIFK